MTQYEKGARGERELGAIFEDMDYAYMRAPGSGTGDRELPDVIVGNSENVYAMEVKRWTNDVDYEYIEKYEVHDLEFFAENFNMEYFVAVRFDYGEWGFFKKEELHETENNYRVDMFKTTESQGLDRLCQ